jgi:DNA-binding CsgD family transcriptional regulator
MTMRKKIMNTPGWLALNEDRTAFVYLPDRAEIVREIFDLSIGGLGGYSIAKLLNSRNVPAFGTSGKWDQSTIHNMLTSRATIGEYQKKQTLEGKEYPIGEPVSGYYPPVIEEKTFEAAQIARRNNLSSGRGRKGRFIANLFAGLTRCAYCNSPVKFHRNGPSKSLICANVLEGLNCFRFGWLYHDFERSFLAFFQEPNFSLKLFQLLARLKESMDNQEEEQIYEARVEIAHTLRSLVSIVTIAAAGDNPAASKADALIRRNHPDRFFSVMFSDGSSRTGYPISVPKVNSHMFNPEELSKALGLSPRQATITARLAEGEALAKIATELGMTLSTARWHLREVFRRTNSHSQAELVSLATRVCHAESFGDGKLESEFN